MQCNWRSQTSTFRGLNTMIQRYQVPTSTKASDVQVKYGIAVEVANSTGIGEVRICNTWDCYMKDLQGISQVTTRVSFHYRHQIHCWVAVKSKSRVRGLIVLAAVWCLCCILGICKFTIVVAFYSRYSYRQAPPDPGLSNSRPGYEHSG